ncbi:acyltransferase family protein [Bradyrhizobium roseum]|uniref:acyltransferase family protein n=1 Tax=Bradyrhizobium roseum TaxID=3056648 RepID=UPI00260587B9|nr:acyltransferase family protein [Bradyrhizobium roseus]WKA30823.1 acyltransferase family protein [Bradyrhizobium roseus]
MANTGASPTAASTPAIGDAFRFDVNALRALSVVAVVGFHFQIPGFAGGFVGVDVFLVITGYLMTAKVLNELKLGRFSPWAFWMMRMRRIYPALAALTIASVVAGWFVTLPAEYSRHLLQALSALAFLSNFAFKSDSGYFAMAAQTKPLLHTWSLSLEWQFYFFMPLIVGLVWRLSLRAMSGIDAIIVALRVFAVLSLAWCLWASQQDATGSSFFSLQARAWEPLAGGLIAAAEIRRRSEGMAEPSWLQSPTVAVAGWLLVAGCVVYPLPEARWPGVLTILPVLGSAMIIAARQASREGGLLGVPAIQRVGDWSYSIYLWHWPVWVFALSFLSLRGYGVGAAQKTLMVLLSLALGAISYRYVEQPFRIRRDFWTPRRLLGGSAVAFASLAAFVSLTFLNKGFPGRLPEYLLPAELARRTSTPRDECFRNANSTKKATETYCSFGSEQATQGLSAILWGDSFANQYLDPVSAAAHAHRIHGLIATQNACRAFIDDAAGNARDERPCREFNRSTLDFVLGPTGPRIVVLGSNWTNALEISVLVDSLLSAGKTVVLIMPLLNIGFDLPQRWIENQIRAGRAIEEWKVEASPALAMRALRDEIAHVLDRYRGNPRLVVVDPQSVVCEQDHCYLVRNGQANFRDTAHISNVNASQYRGLFDAAFKAVLLAGTAVEAKKD